MSEQYCQSCAMPMVGAVYGTESDGSKSTDYCSYCYADGKFLADISMQEMMDFCVKPMIENIPDMTEEKARVMMNEFFPQLKRWRKAEA